MVAIKTSSRSLRKSQMIFDAPRLGSKPIIENSMKIEINTSICSLSICFYYELQCSKWGMEKYGQQLAPRCYKSVKTWNGGVMSFCDCRGVIVSVVMATARFGRTLAALPRPSSRTLRLTTCFKLGSDGCFTAYSIQWWSVFLFAVI